MRWPKNLLVITAALLLSVPFALSVSAASLQPDLPDPAQAARDEADLYGVEGEITSISDRLKQLESQKAETVKLQVETKQRLAQLTAASKVLLPKLEGLGREVHRKRDLLKEAISHDYQRHPDGAMMALAQSGSVSETMAQAKYSQIVRDHVDQLARDAKEAADELQKQKEAYDSQKRDSELTQRQLADISQSVAAHEAESAELLANRTNEAVYLAERIDRSKAAEDALLTAAGGNAIWGVFSEGAQVRQGDVIGREGSTGFSTGCHTHFSTIKNGQWHNPENFWNVLRRPDGRLIQPYGMTEWAKRGVYGGHIHNGIDVVQGCGRAVRAAADGTIIRDNRTDGSGFGHYIMIRHVGGLITLYGHLL